MASLSQSLALVLCIILIQGAQAIDIKFSASQGGGSVSTLDSMCVDDSVSVSGWASASFDRLSMTTSREVSGSGDAYLYQRLQGDGDGADWTADHLLATTGSSNLVDVSGATLQPTACDLARTIEVYGTASVMVEGSATQGPDNSRITTGVNGEGDADGAYTGNLRISTGHSADVGLSSKIAGAVIANSASDGVFSEAYGPGATNNLEIIDSTIEGAALNGVHVVTSNGAAVNSVSIEGSTIDNSGSRGVYVFTSDDSASGGLSIERSTIDNSGSHGVYVLTADGSTSGGLSIEGSTIDNSGHSGVYVHAASDSTFNDLSIKDTTIKNSGHNGVGVAAYAGSTISRLSIEDSTIDNTGRGDGVNALSNGAGSSISGLSIKNSLIDNTGWSGIGVSTYYGATFSGLSIEGSTIRNSNYQGVFISAEGDTVDDLSAHYSNIYNNGRNLGIDSPSSVEFNAANNWWGEGGTGDDAGKPGEGGNNGVSSGVIYSPWSTTKFT